MWSGFIVLKSVSSDDPFEHGNLLVAQEQGEFLSG